MTELWELKLKDAMTEDTRPACPPTIGGVYRQRNGYVTHFNSKECVENGSWDYHGRGYDENNKMVSDFDLIELLAVAVPVQELAQLRRAEAACRACIGVDLGKYESLDLKIKTFQEWLAHHTKGTL